VPPRGYKSVSLKLEVYERLESLARSRGLSSANDVIVMLLEVYEVCRATQPAQAQASSQPQGERRSSLADILGLR
jgi:macrodomain Ter protein organizer (MatP/YcbG family)